MADQNKQSGPLDGSTSGTIGGGGRETGGPTDRPAPSETPAVKPDDAASGRMAPDALGATRQEKVPSATVEESPGTEPVSAADDRDRDPKEVSSHGD